MKAKDALKFMLTNYVSAEDCGIMNICAGNDADGYFGGIADGYVFQKEDEGEYFYFFSDNDNHKYDLAKILEISRLADSDFCLPTKDGYWELFRIDD